MANKKVHIFCEVNKGTKDSEIINLLNVKRFDVRTGFIALNDNSSITIKCSEERKSFAKILNDFAFI